VVFVYDEIGVFGGGPLTDYIDISTISGTWRDLLVKYGLHHAILGSASADVSALLELGWTVNCYEAPSGRVVMSAGGSPPASPPPPPSRAPAC
jgi:hypothetical protein